MKKPRFGCGVEQRGASETAPGGARAAVGDAVLRLRRMPSTPERVKQALA